MSDFADVTLAVLGQVMKVIKGLTDEDMKRVAIGDTKLVLLHQGHKIVEQSPALDQAIKVIGQLADDDRRQVETREARVVILRRGEKIVAPFSAEEVAAEVAKLTSEADVVRFLDADSRLGGPNLKKVASELNIAIPATVKTKPALQVHIAQALMRDGRHWNWR